MTTKHMHFRFNNYSTIQRTETQNHLKQQMTIPYTMGYQTRLIPVQRQPDQSIPTQQVARYEEGQEIPLGLIEVFRMINKLHSVCIGYIVIIDGIYSFDYPMHYNCGFTSHHPIHHWSLF